MDQAVAPRISTAAGVVVGAAVFVALQAAWRSPELGWLATGLSSRRRFNDSRVAAEVVNV
jgi:hypothetical protein